MCFHNIVAQNLPAFEIERDWLRYGTHPGLLAFDTITSVVTIITIIYCLQLSEVLVAVAHDDESTVLSQVAKGLALATLLSCLATNFEFCATYVFSIHMALSVSKFDVAMRTFLLTN